MIRYENDKKYAYFEGLKYTRDDKTGYYLNSTNRKRLHRAVWEHYNGSIPSGFHVHHNDRDKGNNEINNLKLLPHSKHTTIHGYERADEHYQEMCDNLSENARPKANEWHKSKEGKEWHRNHYKKIKDKLLKEVTLKCEYCGEEYTAPESTQSRFCSNKCKSAWRRKEGLDLETRICEYCGNEFKANKYRTARTCSKSCAAYLFKKFPWMQDKKH